MRRSQNIRWRRYLLGGVIVAGCDAHCFRVSGRNLLEEESMNFKGYSLKGVLGALAIGAALLLGGSEMAYAQDYHQRHERQDRREHQQRERYLYGDSRALRARQRRERYQLERHQ